MTDLKIGIYSISVGFIPYLGEDGDGHVVCMEPNKELSQYLTSNLIELESSYMYVTTNWEYMNGRVCDITGILGHTIELEEWLYGDALQCGHIV